MYRFLNALNTLLGRLVSLALVGLVAVVGWFGYRVYFSDRFALQDAQKRLAQQQERIQSLTQQLEAKQREIERLALAVRLLKVDHRVGQIEVLSQEGDAQKGDLTTRFSFVELDEKGRPLEPPKLFTIKGDVVYVDHWIIKFSDEYIERNDPLRNRSLLLFRRIFSEKQAPERGYSLDAVGAEPAGYRSGGKLSDFERAMWARFWEYVTEPEKAKKEGVRAAHGDAVYTKLLPGKRYRLELRASDGLTIRLDDSSAQPAGPAY